MSLSATYDNLTSKPINRIDIWPLVRRGKLKAKESEQKRRNLEKELKRRRKWERSRYDEFSRIVDTFHSNQKTRLSWILAAIIGIIGNFVIGSLYGKIQWEKLGVLHIYGFFILIGLIVDYFQRFSFDLRYQFVVAFPDPEPFPKGYEQYISRLRTPDINSQNVLNNKMLNILVEKFCYSIALGFIRDQFLEFQLEVLKIRKLEEAVPGPRKRYPVLEFQLEVNPRSTFYDLNIANKAKQDFSRIVVSLTKAMMIYNAHWYDTSSSEWQHRGSVFLSRFAGVDMKEMSDRLIDQIKKQEL